MIRRGDIYYIQPQESVGSEQWSGRPAVVVSNDKNNEFSSTVEIVYLTTQPKKELDTHATTRATGIISTALCEQVTSVDKSRLGNWTGKCTDEEMKQIDEALKISLDLSSKKKIQISEEEMIHICHKEEIKKAAESAKVEAERDVYKKMYENITNELVSLAKWQKSCSETLTAPTPYPYSTFEATAAVSQVPENVTTCITGDES